MKHNRKKILALLAALTLILLAGCGNTTQSGEDGAPVQTENGPEPVQDEGQDPAELPPEGEGGENEDDAPAPGEDSPEEAPETPSDAPEEIPQESQESEPASAPAVEPEPEPAPEPEPEGETVMAGDTYMISVTLEGGSGRATVESPAKLRYEGGTCWATIIWSSPNFDYMKVDGQRYDPINTDGNSTFEIPVSAFDTPLPVIADTVAMSEPHEVEYTLTFDSGSMQDA